MNVSSLPNTFTISAIDTRVSPFNSQRSDTLATARASLPQDASAVENRSRPGFSTSVTEARSTAPLNGVQASAETRAQQQRENQILQQEQAQISDLAARDREVRAHEQAHAAVGGQYAGAPTYQFQRGPDGVRYAVGGEVSIDISRAATPEETVRKMQIVRRAALAPAEPSPQDRRVAAQAAAIEAQARQEISAQSRAETEAATSASDAPGLDEAGIDESGIDELGANSDASAQAPNLAPAFPTSLAATASVRDGDSGFELSASDTQAPGRTLGTRSANAIEDLLQIRTIADASARSPGSLVSRFV